MYKTNIFLSDTCKKIFACHIYEIKKAFSIQLVVIKNKKR
jgi:hypothetical protein